MRSVAWLALVLGLLGSVPDAGAQPRRRGGAAERRGGAASPERREQVKKKIRALRAFTLTEELVLDEQTASRLFPALARYDDETDRLLQKRIDVQDRLRHADQVRDPRALERLIDEALANQRGFWQLEDKRIAELRKILTPVQAARLLVVLPALERRIQNQLRRALLKQRGGAPADDPDDDPQSDEGEPAGKPRREAPLAPASPSAPRNSSNAPGNTPPCGPGAQPCP